MTAPYQPSTGLSSLQARVLSVDGNLAAVQDQLGRQLQVRRDWTRAKGTDLPQPGETWMITKEFGNTWSFALLLSASHSPPGPGPSMIVMANQAARDALTGVKAGQMVFRLDSGLTDIYNGQSWHGMTRLNISGPQITVTSLAVSTTAVTLTSIPIPDPGWPYQISFSGMVSIGFPSGMGLNVQARDGSNSGASLLAPTSISVSAATGAVPYPVSGTTATLTGPRTVYIALQTFSGSGTVTIAGGALNRIFAELRPVP